MAETTVTRVAWRRRSASHDYVGTLATTDLGLRLDGREPSTGIELSLSIPYSEIDDVRAANGSDSAGDQAGPSVVVLHLAGSEPVLLRGVENGSRSAGDLAELLARLRARAAAQPC
jgi:hypothetical protein